MKAWSPAEETARIHAARGGDSQAFAGLVEPYRNELIAHCYRLLGSSLDAEDAVQDVLLRAWQHLDGFEGRAPIRAWLYKIATNVCFDRMAKRPRRALPSAMRLPSDPGQPFEPPVLEPIWLEPFADSLIADASGNPDARHGLRESVSLAFVAVLQTLTPEQRVVLVLRDVLEWRAAEVAEMLDMTVSAVNSALRRARVALGKRYQPERLTTLSQPKNPLVRDVLEQYVQAWERADVSALVALLRDDTIFIMPPLPCWYVGPTAIADFFDRVVFVGSKRRWRTISTRANGQPAFALYQFDATDGAYHPYAIQVLRVEGGKLIALMAFMTAALVGRFGMPARLDADAST